MDRSDGCPSLSGIQTVGGDIYLLCGSSERPVGRPPELELGGLQVWGSGSVDRLGREGEVEEIEARLEQHTLSDSSRCSPQEPGLKNIVVEREEALFRLGKMLWLSDYSGRDVCRSLPLSRHVLQSPRVDGAGDDQRIRQKRGRLHSARSSQKDFCFFSSSKGKGDFKRSLSFFSSYSKGGVHD